MGPEGVAASRRDELLPQAVEDSFVDSLVATAYARCMRIWKGPHESGAPAGDGAGAFDPTTTRSYQVKMKRAPAWLCSLMAGNHREQRRFRDELVTIRGSWRLLLKQRRGGTLTGEEREELKRMLRAASSVSPYLFIWALPGSIFLLPLLAWYLDSRRKARRPRAP